MSENSKDPDSWKNFIWFQCFMMIFITPFQYAMIERMAPKGQMPGSGWVFLNIALGLISGCGVGLIHRLIRKRNNALGFFYITATVPTVAFASAPNLTFVALLQARALHFLALAFFVVVVDAFSLWNEYRKTRNRKPKIVHDPLMDDFF